MQRRPLNISAALAISIERQVEDIIANARTQCAHHNHATAQENGQDLTTGSAALSAHAVIVTDDAARLASISNGSDQPRLGPELALRPGFWRRLTLWFAVWPRRF